MMTTMVVVVVVAVIDVHDQDNGFNDDDIVELHYSYLQK